MPMKAPEKHKLYPTNDWIFKKIYGRKGSERITEDLIRTFLGLDIKIKELNEQKGLETDMYSEKAGVLDVLVQAEDGTQIDLEMQVGNYQYIELRLVKYVCMLFSKGLLKGEIYEKTRKTIALMFVTGEMPMIKKYSKYRFKWNFREEEFHDLILTDKLEIVIISLGKIQKAIEEGKLDKKDKVALWTKFLLNPNELEEEEMDLNEYIKEATEKYNDVVDDVFEANEAIRREQFLVDIMSMKHEGETSKAKEIAKKLLAENISLEIIVKTTGLTKEEIEALKEN